MDGRWFLATGPYSVCSCANMKIVINESSVLSDMQLVRCKRAFGNYADRKSASVCV